MVSRFILSIVSILVLFTTCKKSDETPIDIKSDIKSLYSLQNQIARVFQATLSDTITDEFAHSEKILAWIQQHPDVQKVTMSSLYVFDIKHKNGLSGNILFTKKQTDIGLATRGGNGGASGKMKLLNNAQDDKKISNKNVLIILQYADDFYKPYCYANDAKHIQSLVDIFEYSEIDFNVTLKVDEGLPAFLDLSNYGIIIFNTHGTPTGLMSGTDVFYTDNLVAFSDDVEVADVSSSIAAQLRNEQLKITSLWEYEKATKEMTIKNASYELTFSFFESLPVTFDNTVLIGNYCFSGIQNGIMGDILEPKGLKSFYGYGYNNGRSYEVTNDLCWRAEDTIVTNLIKRDTTGIAHLANNNTLLQDDRHWENLTNRTRQRLAENYFMFGPQTLNQHLDPGYKFAECGDTITDPRDGQQYPTVCIGDQVWMAKNLNWAGTGRCYNENPLNCDNTSRLYTWPEATNITSSGSNPDDVVQGICPTGWHVPSLTEWTTLIDELGGPAVAGGELKGVNQWFEANVGATNSSGFTAYPGGYGTISVFTNEWTYQNYGATGYWLTSTEDGENEAYQIGMAFVSAGASTHTYNKLDAFSLRCIKD